MTNDSLYKAALEKTTLKLEKREQEELERQWGTPYFVEIVTRYDTHSQRLCMLLDNSMTREQKMKHTLICGLARVEIEHEVILLRVFKSVIKDAFWMDLQLSDIKDVLHKTGKNASTQKIIDDLYALHMFVLSEKDEIQDCLDQAELLRSQPISKKSLPKRKLP